MKIEYAKCGLTNFSVDLSGLGVKCSKCRKHEALVHLRYARQKLCKDCFNEHFVSRLRRAVEKYRMFKSHEKVAVAVSGGKDSVALLHALKHAFPEQDIVAIHINLGIAYYSDHLEGKVRQLAQQLNVPLIVYNLKKEEDYTIDDFLKTKFRKKMCSVCGIIKRHIFSKLASDVKADVVATGHNLDDMVGTMMASFFAGDFESIARLKPVLKPLIPGQPRKIKPLITTPEIEDLYYVLLNELPVQACSCPHSLGSSVKNYKQMIDMLEERNPNVKYQLLSVFTKKLIPLIEKEQRKEVQVIEVHPCKICGLPTSSEDGVCSKCKRVQMLKSKEFELKMELEPNEVEQLMKDEEVVFIDTRSKEEYEKEHIEGALNIPREVFDKRFHEAKKLIRNFKGKYIITYCNVGQSSYAVAVRLRNMGYKAYNLKGGFSAWRRYSLV